MEYHVSKSGNDSFSGTIDKPFLTISKAASVLDECDTVIVHEGLYRECVIVQRGARNAGGAITFAAADGEKVVISGSEEINNWENLNSGIYKTVIPNSFFDSYNPYIENIWGDWLNRPLEKLLHTGQVYINGIPLTESPDMKSMTENTWYCEADEDYTYIYANFGNANPYENLIEINVRKSCFSAGNSFINHIVVRGFEICHAATNWSPPTSEQTGAICANWCKGWIIENNTVHHSRCCGICIGKDKTGGHNLKTLYQRKTGHLSQLEVVFDSLGKGWSKELVGSHIVRNNIIYDCGQTGIVGHMGCAFSEVYGNHIYNIADGKEYMGAETAGIKLHAAIDTYIHNNNIHGCIKGMWLDWQAQGLRISSNLMFDNIDEDIMLEVNHGPHMIDNNILLSDVSITNLSQGGAYVHNLIGGNLFIEKVLDRYTPCHVAHSTQVKNVVITYDGDDRWYNNIFSSKRNSDGGMIGVESYKGYIITEEEEEYFKSRFEACTAGTEYYNGAPVSMDEYIKRCGNSDERNDISLPVYINGNSYTFGAKSFDCEENNAVSDTDIGCSIIQEDGSWYLVININKDCLVDSTEIIGKKQLNNAVFSEADFENPDGSELVINKDYLGKKRSTTPTVGPFENLTTGQHKILVWSCK